MYFLGYPMQNQATYASKPFFVFKRNQQIPHGLPGTQSLIVYMKRTPSAVIGYVRLSNKEHIARHRGSKLNSDRTWNF